MAVSRESVRLMITDLERFLQVTLKNEKLTSAAKEHRLRLIETVKHFNKTGNLPEPISSKNEFREISEKFQRKSEVRSSIDDSSSGGSAGSSTKGFDTVETVENLKVKNLNKSKTRYIPDVRVEEKQRVEEVTHVDTDEQESDFRGLLETIKKKTAKSSDNVDEIIPVTAARDLVNPDFCCFLEDVAVSKTGTLASKTLIESWCVIQQGLFYIFDHEKERFQRDAFYLSGYRFSQDPELTRDATRKPLAFVLRCAGKRSYYFIAKNQNDLTRMRKSVEESQKGKRTETTAARNTSPRNDTELGKSDKEDNYLIPTTPLVEKYTERNHNSDDAEYDKLDDFKRDADKEYTMLVETQMKSSDSPPELPSRKEPPVNKKTPKKKLQLFKTKKSKSVPQVGETPTNNIFVTLKSYKAEEEVELSFEKGDEITVLWADKTSETMFGKLNGKVGKVHPDHITPLYERVDSH